MARKALKQAFKTPLCELRWVNISKEGADQSMEKDGSKMMKVATAIITDAQAKTNVANELNSFWDYCKEELNLKKGQAPKSLGFKELVDDDGNLTGEVSLLFKTNVTFPDGSDNVIKVLNARGKEVDLGDKKIGNGSIGVIHGEVAYYDAAGSKGLTLYLKAIQLKKLVEYTANIDAEDLSDGAEDEFTGESDGMEDVPEI